MGENRIISELAFHSDEGALRYKGIRYLLIRPETIASLQVAVEDHMGIDLAGDALYAGGFTGGRLSGLHYKESLGLSDREAVEFMCQMGAEIGWGKFRLIDLDSAARRLFVEVDHSPFPGGYKRKSDAGICHLIRGVLGGLGNGIFNTEVQARETACLACGDPCCRFEIEGTQHKKQEAISP